jgi:threonine/homoserine/homoserine lactone efflux protein
VTLAAYLSAVLALLLAPGPTNTLMGVAGAQGGIGRVLRLLPAELAGYLTSILPLVWIGAQVLERFPATAVALKLAAAVWVMVLAVRLWGLRGAQDSGEVAAGRIFLTTMLNPKALVFGLVLLPSPAEPEFLLRLSLFCFCVAGVALVWGAAGALSQAGANGGFRLLAVQRIASVWLGLVSVTLLIGLVSG